MKESLIEDNDNTICCRCLKPRPKENFRLKKNGQPKKTCTECEEKEKIRTTTRIEECDEEKEKVCSGCKQVVPLDQYKKTKKGYSKRCQKCLDIGRRSQQKAKDATAVLEIDETVEKLCPQCNKVCPLTEFNDRSTGDKTSHCKKCIDYQMKYLNEHKCPHGKLNKSACKQCNGGSICKHGRIRTYCKHCQGGSLCEHNQRKDRCKKCEHLYGRNQYCEHDVLKTSCLRCKGGSICEHERRRTRCIECEGGTMCEHKIERYACRDCDFIGFLTSRVCSRIRKILQSNKTQHSIEYLGCDIKYYREYLEKQFVEGMTWENYGTIWEIDHVVPLKFNEPTLNEVVQRLHYRNTQPLWTEINAKKGHRYIYWLQQADASIDERSLSKGNVVKRSRSTPAPADKIGI